MFGWADNDHAVATAGPYLRPVPLHGVRPSSRDSESLTWTTTCGFVVELIGQRAAELDERIAQLEGLREDLRSLARRAERLDVRCCDPRLVCHVVETAS